MTNLQKIHEGYIKPILEILAFAFGLVGLVLAYHGFQIARGALERNTEANKQTTLALEQNSQAIRVGSRSQLYESEWLLNDREYRDDDVGLATIYAHPSPWIHEPADYLRARLGLVTKNPDILSAPTVAALYERIWSYDAVADLSGDSAKLRKIYLHLEAVLSHMHAALDYKKDHVISEAEWETWRGYLTDVGPHPILLCVILNWRRNDYMSQDFSHELQGHLWESGSREEAFVKVFYQDLTKPDFVNGPNY